MTKECKICHEHLPLTSFSRHAQTKDRLHPYCKACVTARAKKWAEENPDRNRETKRRNAAARREQCPEYDIWVAMKQRCSNPSVEMYPHYGGRGISVCERWNDFKAFYEDMGPRPSSQHSLDRIDNDGNYFPENCRWTLPETQARNTRQVRMIEFDGKRLCLTDWAKELGIHHQTLRNRLNRGWTVEQALSTPHLDVGRDEQGRLKSPRL